jgi:hypothetical protein
MNPTSIHQLDQSLHDPITPPEHHQLETKPSTHDIFGGDALYQDNNTYIKEHRHFLPLICVDLSKLPSKHQPIAPFSRGCSLEMCRTLFLPSFLPSSFLPSFLLPSFLLPSFLPSSFLPSSFLPSFLLPSFLPSFLPSLPPFLPSFLSFFEDQMLLYLVGGGQEN